MARVREVGGVREAHYIAHMRGDAACPIEDERRAVGPRVHAGDLCPVSVQGGPVVSDVEEPIAELDALKTWRGSAPRNRDRRASRGPAGHHAVAGRNDPSATTRTVWRPSTLIPK